MKQVPRCALLLLMAAIAAMAASCGHGGNTATPETQDNFGVQMARANLWREAMFRFRRAVEINPNDAMAHNNLAVAYEANGDYDNALKEYREALRLDRSNQYVQKNYSRFIEFRQRNNKRQKGQPATAANPAAPGTSTAPAGTASQASSQPVATTTTAPANPAPAPATPPEATSTAAPVPAPAPAPAPATSTAPPPVQPPAQPQTPPPTPPPASNPPHGGSR